jgi:hypothetical protein
MTRLRASDNVKGVLLIVTVGTVFPVVFYLSGYHIWALVGLGFIPFFFGCWALSWLLAGSRNREIWAHLTAQEREQAFEMSRAFGKRMGRWLLPVGFLMMILAMLGFLCASRLHPQGVEGVGDYVLQNQLVVLEAGLAIVVAGVLVFLPAALRQRRAMTDFFGQTEYARRQREAPGQL